MMLPLIGSFSRFKISGRAGITLLFAGFAGKIKWIRRICDSP
jgi:hypothetical protein